jgi:hypothetical protein
VTSGASSGEIVSLRGAITSGAWSIQIHLDLGASERSAIIGGAVVAGVPHHRRDRAAGGVDLDDVIRGAGGGVDRAVWATDDGGVANHAGPESCDAVVRASATR